MKSQREPIYKCYHPELLVQEGPNADADFDMVNNTQNLDQAGS